MSGAGKAPLFRGGIDDVKRKNHRRKGGDPHVRLHAWLLNSPAFRSLTPAARALLVEMYALFNGINNGQIYPGVRGAAERVGICTEAVAKAFKQLEEVGFIRAAERGGFTRKNRQATRWVLTEFEHAGQLATREFMRWVPPPPDPRKKQNTVRKNRTVA